ncbi:Nucleolar protein 6 [Nakaseomyces bracarensis]|uniref:Nucleolar protein 6 n=1 Tax=Nakaseomyces bracarensis TaxID=273131 RepID=A0ABR4NN72_9SACH
MVEQDEKKLTKKQLKALQFRKSKEEKEVAEKRKLEEPENPVQEGEAPKKKRKTRRGRGGKGKKNGGGNRFLVFVGGLPKDVTASELQVHFKSSGPDQIRVRGDKGIAFLEFDGDKDQKTIQRRMDIALLQNKTLLRDKRINVELTVGGGGNSQDRLEKLKKKNEKFEAERQERMQKLMSKPTKPATSANGEEAPVAAGIHPDRARMIK